MGTNTDAAVTTTVTPQPRGTPVYGGTQYSRADFTALQVPLMTPEIDPNYRPYHLPFDKLAQTASGKWVFDCGSIINVYNSLPRWAETTKRINDLLDDSAKRGVDPVVLRSGIDQLKEAAFVDYNAHASGHFDKANSSILAVVRDLDPRCLVPLQQVFRMRLEDETKSCEQLGQMAFSHCSEMFKLQHIVNFIGERIASHSPGELA